MHPNGLGARGRRGAPGSPGVGAWRRVLLGLAAAAAVVACSAACGSAEPPAPAPPAQALPPGVNWSADAHPDLLPSFDRTTYNEHAGPPVVVPSPNVAGRPALQFTVPPGGVRSELLPHVPEQREGATLFFGYDGYLPRDYPIGAGAYQIIMQWHHEGDSGSPPLAVHARNGQLLIAGGDDLGHRSYEEPFAPARAGMPVHLVLRVVFSRDPAKASIDVWSGGAKVVTNFHPPDGTLYDAGDYLKVGMYRDTSLPDTARVFVNDVAVGTSYAAVDAAIAPKPQVLPPAPASSTMSAADSGGRTAAMVSATVALVAVLIATGGVALARGRRGHVARAWISRRG